jgi:ABC-type phosphate transport system substrate-binding protein
VPIVRLLCYAFALCAAMASAQVTATDVIVNAGVSVTRLKATELRNMYMLRQTQWSNGQRVVLFVLADDNPVHESFAKETLGLYAYRLRQTWDRLSFSGMAAPPIEVRDENEMRARVTATPGAVGYVKKGASNDGYKILRLD